MSTVTETKKMKFRLLRGTHSQKERDPSGVPCEQCEDGKVEVPWKKKPQDCPACLGTGIQHITVTYDSKDNNLVESTTDLETKFGYEKFQNLDRMPTSANVDNLQSKIAELQAENERLRQSVEAEDSPEDQTNLNDMSVRQLRAYAKDHDIDVSEANGKEEIINVIQWARENA